MAGCETSIPTVAAIKVHKLPTPLRFDQLFGAASEVTHRRSGGTWPVEFHLAAQLEVDREAYDLLFYCILKRKS